MVSKESNIKIVLAGLLIGIFMAAIDNTIVATAMATIVSDLGGLEQFVWVTSAYMVATMAGMPIFGKLSDMYGRKKFFLFGIIVFTLGSILCGTADSMIELSMFRAIQGIGGGALMPIAFTIIFDLYPPETRGKIMGLFGAVFGTSNIFGPLLGAVITDSIGWNWIFYINVPLSVLAFIFVSFFYHESVITKKPVIDWGGALTLIVSVVCLMFTLELGGNTYAWDSVQIISLLIGFFIFITLFFFFERRAEEPIINFSLFKRKMYATSMMIAFLYGSVFVIGTIYMPLYIQAVFGGSATSSGMILMPMMLASTFSSQVAGFLTTRMSYRNIMKISAVFFLSGIILLGFVSMDTPKLIVMCFMILLGLGVGFSFSLLSLSSVHNLEPHYRGSANSTVAFFRSLGMTIGITVFGAIQSSLLAAKISADTLANQAIDTNELLQATKNSSLSANAIENIQYAFSSSISTTFLWALIPAILAVIAILYMPKDRLIIKKSKNETPISSANK